MKNDYRVLTILAFLPLLMVVLVFLFTPNTLFPMQYGSNGEIYRWGSKLELFVYAAIPLIIALGAKIWLKNMHTKEKAAKNGLARNEKIVQVMSHAIILFIDSVLFLALYKGFFIVNEKQIPLQFDFMKIVGIGVGIVFVVIGNYLPKIGFNSILGIRTPWSISSEAIWVKTQRAGGITLILSGIIVIIFTCIAVNEGSSGLYVLISVLAVAILPVGYSYLLYMKTKK